MKKLLFILSMFVLGTSVAQNNNAFSSKIKTGTAAKPSFQYQTINGQTSSSPTNFYLGSVSATKPEWSVIKDKETGLPILIDGIKLSTIIASKTNKVDIKEKVLSEIQDALKIKDAKSEFKTITSETDAQQNQHIKIQQTKNGLEVYGAQAWLHIYKNGEISFNGRTVATPVLTDFEYSIAQTNAEQIAKNDLQKLFTFVEPNNQTDNRFSFKNFVAEQILLPNPNNINDVKLAWHISVRPNIMHHWEYFIDGKTGAILNKYDNTCAVGPATAVANDLKGVSKTINTFNANSKYYLINATKSMFTGSNSTLPVAGKGTIVTLDLQNTNLNNPSYADITTASNTGWTPTAVSAHNNASIAFDYFKTKFNRNSIDGKGGDVVSFINVAGDNGGNLDNAFWNGQYMFYGNGQTSFKPLARGLDVGGHEMTHGVVQNTANLEYQGESGAINESMADVFGVLIDGTGRTNYKIGVDVVNLSAFPSGALRDMQDPHNGGTSLSSPGYQPAKVSEKYTGTQDNGGVHINSGIPNKAFYLIANSITKAKAEQIYYKALSSYLTKSSKFIDLRIAVVKAATDIHGAGSNEVTVVKQSFDAVEIFDGNGGTYQNNVPTNTGAEGLLIVNTDNTDANTLYLTTSAATSFQPLSQRVLNRKSTVTDNGAFAYFVGATDHNIYAVALTSPFTQTQLTTDGFWDNVAISKDGTKLAAVSTSIDTAIYVFKFGGSSWTKFRLYNPTTAQGLNSGGARYADVLEWDFSGENVLYDSYNVIRSSTAADLDFWDLGIIKVWNNTTNSLGNGTIFKLFSNLEAGESIGNPTYSKNSPYIISFDYINSNTNKNIMYGVNLETGDIGTVFDNGELGTPTYSPLDNKIAFTSTANSKQVVGLINLNADKITGVSSSATAIINDAKWPTWFSKGTRILGVNNKKSAIELSIYPNPVNDKLFIELKNNTNIKVTVYNLAGELMNTTFVETNKSIDVSALAKGNYIVHITTDQGEASKVFIKL
jgi:bacillolysin